MKTYVLYNKKANNGQGAQGAFRIKDIWTTKELVYKEVNEFDTYAELFTALEADDEVVVCGGDGTLNFLINEIDCDAVDNPVYYYPTGTGNDFWTDIGKGADDALLDETRDAMGFVMYDMPAGLPYDVDVEAVLAAAEAEHDHDHDHEGEGDAAGEEAAK